MRRRPLLAAVLLLCVALPALLPAGEPQPASFTLYLVRHAEKQVDAGDDPGLTEAGVRRAERLARWLEPRGLAAAWSSDFRRSRDTGRPVAERLALPLRLYDVTDLPGLAERLMAEGRNALVVGHSDTSPELAGLLCGCPVEAITDEEYDWLWRLAVHGGAVTLERLDQREFELTGR